MRLSLKKLVLGAALIGSAYYNRGWLRQWGLRTLAGNSPVMMNVTIDQGIVKVADAKFGYFYRNIFKGAPFEMPRWKVGA